MTANPGRPADEKATRVALPRCCEARMICPPHRGERCEGRLYAEHGGRWLCFEHAEAVRMGVRTLADVLAGSSIGEWEASR